MLASTRGTAERHCRHSPAAGAGSRRSQWVRPDRRVLGSPSVGPVALGDPGQADDRGFVTVTRRSTSSDAEPSPIWD